MKTLGIRKKLARALGYKIGGRENLSVSNGNTYYDGTFLHVWEDDYGPVSRLWLPDEDIAAAFQVVEEMRKRDYSFALQEHVDDPDGPWNAGFCDQTKIPNHRYRLRAAKFIPMAISLAALAALEAK